MLEPAMFIGLGAVAVWTHVNYPRLRPGSLLRAIVHVAVSFGAFALLPTVLSFLLPLVPVMYCTCKPSMPKFSDISPDRLKLKPEFDP